MSKYRQEFIGDQELPNPAGRYESDPAYLNEIGMDYQNAKWSLTGLTSEHVLFSAVALGFAGIDFDPVSLYWAEAGLSLAETPYLVNVGKEILKGLPPPLNCALFACPKPYADGLFRALDRFGVSNGIQTMVSVHQKLPMVDWPLLSRVSVAPVKPPTVTVDLYGLSLGTQSLMWVAPSDPWRFPVTLQTINSPPKVTPKLKKRKDNL